MYQLLNNQITNANNYGTIVTETILKSKVNPKDLIRSRRNFLLLGLLLFSLCMAISVFTSCDDGKISSHTDPGVVINGVKWATRNVDEVGTFAPTNKPLGKQYEWNHKKAFQVFVDNQLENDNYNPSGIKWENVNDPSPKGWRVPTYDEIASLLDKDKVSEKFCTQNSAPGVLFTDKTTGNTLFFPIEDHFVGNVHYLNTSIYWSNAQFARLRFDDNDNTCHSLVIALPSGTCFYNFDNINLDYSIDIGNIDEKSTNLKRYTCYIRSVEDIPPADEVLINGVRWATRNVGDCGTFAESSRAIGKLYQWNRKKAWSPSEGKNKRYDWRYPEWDITFPSGITWEEINDPSPTGWRVPTTEEIKSLLDENKVSRKRFHEGGVIHGIYDFEGVAFTDKATGNTLYLPLTGSISMSGMYFNYWAHYWSNAADVKYFESAYKLNFMSDGDIYGKVSGVDVISIANDSKTYGYAIRSVRK